MTPTISFAPVRKTVRVKAAPERAFAVFARGSWWPKENSILGAGKRQKEVVIEPRIGGRWFERGEDGTECVWGKVLAWEPPRRMLLAWQLNGKFEYDPAFVSEVEVTFAGEEAGVTRVELEHRHFERVGEAAQFLHDAVDRGWGRALERYAAAALGG